ncbi:lipid A deacylase LpxR family protein [Tenacibaculum piscium]|uniref:lipid A deacylase LpxR family protein n=1 Tax=Tenacibaculum piscium TaxID=1458515 RepID=UPI001F3D5DEB|nr:lipid A deacylase LpxR family protein [Tenacibaculum piscium]
MKQKIFFFLILYKTTLFAQQKQPKEFSIITDNDLYISLTQDRYYTNGLFLTYRYLAKKTSKNALKNRQKVIEFKLGNQMYTPFKASVKYPENHDRPFAGYSFGSIGITRFYQNNTLLKTDLQIGMLGSASKSKELQSFVHTLYGYEKITGWKYQIKNTFGFNFKINYLKSLTRLKNNLNKLNTIYIDANWISTVNFGTIHTDISTGFYTRIGLKPLQKIINSIAFHGNLIKNTDAKTDKSKIESFIYIKPMLHYVAYDATIQGGFLSENTNPITYRINPFKMTTEIGIRFTANHFNFGYIIKHHTKKLKSWRVPSHNFYGTLEFNYMFN